MAEVAQGPVVAVLNVGSPKELPWLKAAGAVLVAYFGGEQTAPALAGALLGHTNPAGRLPSTWPKCVEHSPAVAAPPSVPQSPGDTPYNERLHLGYRGYGAGGLVTEEPAFAFGHGLSYTSFDLGAPRVELLDGLRVSVQVRNTGARSGAEVIQVYVEASGPRALQGFQKTRELAPGDAEEVQLLLPRALQHFDAATGTWQRATGKVRVRVATSSLGGQDVVVNVSGAS